MKLFKPLRKLSFDTNFDPQKRLPCEKLKPVLPSLFTWEQGVGVSRVSARLKLILQLERNSRVDASPLDLRKGLECGGGYLSLGHQRVQIHPHDDQSEIPNSDFSLPKLQNPHQNHKPPPPLVRSRYLPSFYSVFALRPSASCQLLQCRWSQ